MFDDDNNNITTWYCSDNIIYCFHNSSINGVETHIKYLEDIVGKYMSSYNIIDRDETKKITYEYKLPTNVSPQDIKLIARLCLGKQILHCLYKKGRCYFVVKT